MHALATVPRSRAFAEPGVTTASWFPVARSARVRPGRVLRAEAPGGDLVLWRPEAGRVAALNARCPHLGADLGQGTVEAGAVRCPFHGWTFGPDGACVGAPGCATPPRRRAQTVPVQERWGFVWAANTLAPPFDLPEPPPGNWRTLRPPSQSIAAHPHLVIGNGLDTTHFDALHGFEPLAEPVLTVDPPRVRVEMHGRPRSQVLRRLIGGDVRFRFETTGGHLATVETFAPIRLWALFSATPTPTGCRTQVVVRLPRGPVRALRAFVGLYALLHDDARVLERLRFRRAFAPADAPLAAFAGVVDGLPLGR